MSASLLAGIQTLRQCVIANVHISRHRPYFCIPDFTRPTRSIINYPSVSCKRCFNQRICPLLPKRRSTQLSASALKRNKAECDLYGLYVGKEVKLPGERADTNTGSPRRRDIILRLIRHAGAAIAFCTNSNRAYTCSNDIRCGCVSFRIAFGDCHFAIVKMHEADSTSVIFK